MVIWLTTIGKINLLALKRLNSCIQGGCSGSSYSCTSGYLAAVLNLFWQLYALLIGDRDH